MKRFFSLLLTFLTLLIFSCTMMPPPEGAPPDFSYYNELPPESSFEDSLENSPGSEEEAVEEIAEDIAEEVEEEMEDIEVEDDEEDEITFLLMEETTGGDGDELASDEPVEIDTADQLLDLTEADASAEEPEQVVQTFPDPEPAAVVEQAPPPPRQPPPPPPAILGPAEEKPPAEKKPAVIEPSVTQSEPAKDEPPHTPVVSARDTPSPLWSELTTPQNGEIIYSRIIRCTAGQMVEVPFRGSGWVYLGELASRRGIVYDSRRIDPEGQTFLFRAEEAGTYSLKFFKQDFIRDYILNDYVQVIVGDAPVTGGSGWFNPPFDRGRVTAQPRWPSALEEAEIQRSVSGTRPPSATPVYTPSAGESSAAAQAATAQAATAQAATAQAATAQEAAANPPLAGELPDDSALPEPVEKLPKMPPEEMLKKARETFDEGNIGAAIALLDLFREYYPAGSDELYWLYGQFYEANTANRDILLALDYYHRLVDEYPQSRRYDDARRRIAYLERFYINIQ